MDFGFPILGLRVERQRSPADAARQRRHLLQSQIQNPKSKIRKGYSFAEVLFAVAVLGIGFIMVAAIFPVAIQQTQATLEESIGTATARNGLNYIQGSPFMSLTGLPYTSGGLPAAPTPPTPANPPKVFGFFDPRIMPVPAPPAPQTTDAQLWDSVKQNLISSDDPRYAYVALYSRDANATFAKVIIFSLHARATAEFTQADLTRPNGGTACAQLEPRPIKINRMNDGGNAGPDTIQLANLASGDDPNTNLVNLSMKSDALSAAAEGAYIIISDDKVGDDNTTAFKNEYGAANGRVYRLGAARPDLGVNVFELTPGEDEASAQEDLPGTTGGSRRPIGFIIGRGYADPADATKGYSGTSMVVQRYENLIPLK